MEKTSKQVLDLHTCKFKEQHCFLTEAYQTDRQKCYRSTHENNRHTTSQLNAKLAMYDTHILQVSSPPETPSDPDTDPAFCLQPTSPADTKQTNRAHLIPHNKGNPITDTHMLQHDGI